MKKIRGVIKICGILGVVINKNSNEVIRNLYEIFVNQKVRGMQGAGISIANGGDLFRFRSVSPFRLFNVFNYDVWQRLGDGCRVLLHHRYPTSSINKVRFNHPIANEENTVHLIHNGVLYNDKELYRKLKVKHTFETLDKANGKITDTEVMVHLFEESYKDKPENIVKALTDVFEKTSGSFAVALQIKGDKNIYLIKHSYPLIISKDNDGNFYFSSELDKDYKSLKKIHEMVEGEIGILNATGYQKLTMVKSEKLPDVMDYSKLSSYQYGNDYHYGYSGKTKWNSSKKDRGIVTDYIPQSEVTTRITNPKKLRIGDKIRLKCSDCPNTVFEYETMDEDNRQFILSCSNCLSKSYFTKKEMKSVLRGDLE